MGLNREGILKLADDLLAHRAMYDQNVFGKRSACGTVCCLAGLCLLNEAGEERFGGRRRRLTPPRTQSALDKTCMAGARQLGIPADCTLFSGAISWPFDLADDYRCATTPDARVVVALKALQRLREDGSIDDDPNAVYTPIPQLGLLAKPKPLEQEQEPAALEAVEPEPEPEYAYA